MGIEIPTDHFADHTARPGEERRHVQRRHLVYYLRAWDSSNNQMLGHIVDITSHGLMLISEEPIQVGDEYLLEVRLPDAKGNIQPYDFKAICRWCGVDGHNSLFDSGFEMVEKSSRAVYALQSLTNNYGFGI